MQTDRSDISADFGPADATVSAWVLDLARDHRDSPIDPQRGYHVALSQEFAAHVFGGNVDYYRVELGAESFVLGNVEVEQALTPAWSLVAFCDVIGLAERVSDYPFNTGLYSVGGGVRWKTIIGPVRLEYGHNLNRRRDDPAGTLHLSIGFPF